LLVSHVRVPNLNMEKRSSEEKTQGEWIIPNGFNDRCGETDGRLQNGHQHYDANEFLLVMAVFQRNTLWMNLGYGPDWDITVAGERLFLNLFTGIDITNFRNVLDCSSGYGDQEIVLSSNIPNLNYVGVNVSRLQNELARYRSKNKCSIFIEASVGSGSLRDWPKELVGTYDMIISSENAFHFPSRDKFYTNCLPLLKPGGYLFVNDIIHHSATSELLTQYFINKGYTVVTIQDISSEVLGFIDLERLYPKWQLQTLGITKKDIYGVTGQVYSKNPSPFGSLGGIKNPCYWKIVLQKQLL